MYDCLMVVWWYSMEVVVWVVWFGFGRLSLVEGRWMATPAMKLAYGGRDLFCRGPSPSPPGPLLSLCFDFTNHDDDDDDTLHFSI